MARMRKWLALAAALLTLAFCLTGCTGRVSEPPDLQVTAQVEGEALSLPWTVGLNQWDSVAYDREDVLVSLMKDQTASAVPQLAEGTTLKLELAQRVPDEAVLTVVVLNEDGSVLEEGEAQTVTLEAAETGSRLTIEVQRPDGQDAQSGELLLGYRLRCLWQENSCEYGWVLRV